MHAERIILEHQSIDVHPKTPFRVHVMMDKYPNKPFQMHDRMDAYPNTPFWTHIIMDMYPKMPFWVHDKTNDYKMKLTLNDMVLDDNLMLAMR